MRQMSESPVITVLSPYHNNDSTPIYLSYAAGTTRKYIAR
uniref:Uncharacterized protein n=1 Tax=Anguilla anguilla TaxID=7936 RepID=A0A0E9VNX3_ANGAN